MSAILRPDMFGALFGEHYQAALTPRFEQYGAAAEFERELVD
ncbi:MAG: hypothetical protein NWS78_11675 [Gammaproteobacteria bacterium]|nr:hypothetical protein [Gammaproteobacteria bacterium]